MSEPFIGEIRAFAFGFTPVGWAPCNGQVIAINANQALFAVLGYTYGGTTNVSFNLPNLNGSGSVPGLAMLGVGQGPGLSNYNLANCSGVANVTLTKAQMAAHNHTINAINVGTTGLYPAPTGQSHLSRYLATPGLDFAYSDQALTGDDYLDASALTPSGAAIPAAHDNYQPYLTFNFCIATDGVFPARN